MADLITLTELKTALGIPDPSAEHPDDAKNAAAISAATEIIRTYTDRTFDITPPAAVATSRQFEYDGSGYLDIDDAQTITTVSAIYDSTFNPTSRPLNAFEWSARPFNKPVKFWLQLPDSPYAQGSPAMGFKYNADTYSEYGRSLEYSIIEVTAVWGWPEIPADIRQAVIWTTLHLAENPKSYIAESIEGYSRAYSIGGGTVDDVLPDRARQVLLPYIVPRV